MKATKDNALTLLIQFANQRPGLDFADYGDISAYRSESREITKDLHDFRELLSLANWRGIPNLSELVYLELCNKSGRLCINDAGDLEYTTGQYFPTEYRPAACRVLRNIIWRHYTNEMLPNEPNQAYPTGDDIRRAVRRFLSRRAAKNYFN